MQSLYQKLKAFMECNRRDQQQHPTGWHERLRAVYMSHQCMRDEKSASATPHLWEKHGGKK